MDEELKSNVLSPNIWLRLLLMLVFGLCASVALWIVTLVAIAQFVFALFTSKPNQHLTEFSAGLLNYIDQLLEFVTFRSEERPFPFSPLPGADSASKPKAAKAAPKKPATRRKKPAPAKGASPATDTQGGDKGS